MDKKIVCITGCSSGFGLITAIEMAKSGYFVIATIRDVNRATTLINERKKHSLEESLVIEVLDVTDSLSIEHFEMKLKEKYKRIDILINNAGFAYGGFVEELSINNYRNQFETNLYGVISITKLVLPLMRKRQNGIIINMSSISGLIGFPALSAYAASKYALEGFTECLRLEVMQFGIKVILIEPGSYQTKIWSKAKDANLSVNNLTNPYHTLQTALEKHIGNESSFGDPIQVAKLILSILKNPKPKFRYSIGKGVKTMLFVKKLLPYKIWEKIVLKTLDKNLF